MIAVDLVDERTGIGVAHATVLFDRHSAADVGFFPNMSYGGSQPSSPFWLGPPGSELCLVGVPPELLPLSDENGGRHVVAGLCTRYPVPAGHSVRVTASAEGYEAVERFVALMPLEPGRLKEQVQRIEMREVTPTGNTGGVRLTVAAGDGDLVRSRSVQVHLWRRRAADEKAPGRFGTGPDEGKAVYFRSFSPRGVTATTAAEESQAYSDRALELQKKAFDENLESVIRWVPVGRDGVGVIRSLRPGQYEFTKYGGLRGEQFVVDSGCWTTVEARESQDVKYERLLSEQVARLRVSFRRPDGVPITGIGFAMKPGRADDHGIVEASGLPPVWLGGEILPPGSTLGAKPVEMTLPLGGYLLEAYRPGYSKVVKEVSVTQAGETIEVVVEMSKENP
jgi:hypothetical protein